ncbi:duodenase-1-like [Emydura macquarii macquarii]|uniref:duodenase-1-like n=1 Tax=Emydura macquarii macquarii TaxID=1129001 RepID=UPI00352A5DBE
MQIYVWLLLPTVLLLPLGAWSGEIIGGRVAEPHSRPYMAFLSRETSTGPKMCGGFLVRKDFVLTAAHCAEGEITVLLGAHNMSKRERSQQVIPARAKIPHPQYDKETYNKDIMLLQLRRKAKLTRWVKTIPLPRTEETVQPGKKCSVAGWGWTSADGEETSDTLQEVDVVVMPEAACWSTPHGPDENYDPSTMLCAGDPDEGKNPSKGDSGGPLVCGRKAQGIVSYDFDDETQPVVYTRVSTFIPWIHETMKKLQP